MAVEAIDLVTISSLCIVATNPTSLKAKGNARGAAQYTPSREGGNTEPINRKNGTPETTPEKPWAEPDNQQTPGHRTHP